MKQNKFGLLTVTFVPRQFLLGIAQRQSYFIIREHKSIPSLELSPLTEIGETETGRVLEQNVQISYDNGNLNLRRVVIQLHQPTRHGDTEVALLTHLSTSVADATHYRPTLPEKMEH